MLTFTGVGVIWQLPLSGPNVDHWSALVVQGDVPAGAVRAALYDAQRERVLASVDVQQRDGYPQGQLWQLSLSGSPTWRQVAPPPEPEITSGLLAIDMEGQRLFVLGAGYKRCGLWSLSLEDDVTWTRVADSPGQSCEDAKTGELYGAGLLAFDGARQRLLASASGLGTWQLALDGGPWTQLENLGFWASGVHDEATARLIFLETFGGQITTLSLSDDTWAQSTFPRSWISTPGFTIDPNSPDNGLAYSGPAALDQKRQRVLFANGNATSELALASLNPQPLLPNHSSLGTNSASSLVWDPKRQAVVSFGGEGVKSTLRRSLKRGDAWQVLAADGPPGYGGSQAYDQETTSIFSYGAYLYGGFSPNLAGLDSAGTDWQTVELPPGPAARSLQLGVFDATARRLVIRGGRQPPGSSDAQSIDDVWLLSLDTLAWTQLAPSGTSPGARSGELGVYDPISQRLIVFGGYRDSQPYASLTDVHALTLGDEPTWSTLEAEGDAPVYHSFKAYYDATGRRMLVLTTTGVGLDVYALELAETPVWHRFCALGAVPAAYGEKTTLTDGGLFLALGETAGAYLFNLSTPYCD
jgi:hypothetical protein